MYIFVKRLGFWYRDGSEFPIIIFKVTNPSSLPLELCCQVREYKCTGISIGGEGIVDNLIPFILIL